MDKFDRIYKVVRLVVSSAVMAGVCGTVIYCINTWKSDSDDGIPHTASEVIETITNVEDHDLEIVQENVPHPVYVDYGDVILGEAYQDCDLKIMSMPVQVSDELFKPGLFGLETVFGQSQGVVYHAEAEFYVDLSELDVDDYYVNDEDHTITITVPYPTQRIIPVIEEYEFFSSSNGILRFGEFEITPESQAEIESNAIDMIDERVRDDEEIWGIVEEYAKLSLEDTFQTSIDAVTYANIEKADDNAQFVYYDVIIEFE